MNMISMDVILRPLFGRRILRFLKILPLRFAQGQNDFFIIILFLFWGSTAFANPGIKDYSNFKKIPVLDNGRLKPLDTFARSLLIQFSGRDHYGKQEASVWLASLYFHPGATVNDRIFLINDPDIPQALAIPPRQDRRYTPAQLQQSYALLAKLDTAAEKIPEKEKSLAENEIIRVFDNVNLYADLSRSFLMAHPLMALAYLKGDDAGFNKAIRADINTIRYSLTKDDQKKLGKFPLEIFYHVISPFTWSVMFYILAFIFFVVSFTSSKLHWYNLGLCSIVAGFIPHVLGLLMRIIIMARPPVSSLYETFIFVSAITVLLGLIIEYGNRQWLGIVTASISGTALLFIANKYSAEGDTLKVLVAVLNSNFWLATHVTTITMGYAATCVGGLLGHIWLLQAVFGQDSKTLEKTYKTILGILGVALTLTFLGTNLGGIWADQSWGRFWGWDPKENGALMIVLWIAILFHAKAGQMIGPRGLAVGAVIGMMVVMWAWFGVNLLSVGLHSYGFTSGIAASLIVYAVVEIIFILVTIVSLRAKRSNLL
jgi:ABC-type transport system involved in cytochrome c biogenesis permease subunit